MITKKKLRYWLNVILLVLIVAAMPIGWLAVSASVSAKVGAVLLVVAALFATVIPAKKKEIVDAIDKSGLPEDEDGADRQKDAGLSSILSVLFLLALFTGICTILYSATARADDSQQFGGCLAGGDVCLGPSASITVGEFNLSTSKFSGGVIPGIGYGATYRPNEWYATGAALYLSFLVGQGQPNQAVPTLMFSFANYVRLGLGLSVTEQDSGPVSTQWKILFGLGSDFGGSPKYVKTQR